MRCAGLEMLLPGWRVCEAAGEPTRDERARIDLYVGSGIRGDRGLRRLQQRDPAGTVSLETGLLLCGASAVACLIVATWGALGLGRVRLAETRAARSVDARAEPQLSN